MRRGEREREGGGGNEEREERMRVAVLIPPGKKPEDERMKERVGDVEVRKGGLLCRICHQIHFTELLSTAMKEKSIHEVDNSIQVYFQLRQEIYGNSQ